MVALWLLMNCRLTWALQNEGVPSSPGGLSHNGTSIRTFLIWRMICWTGGGAGSGASESDRRTSAAAAGDCASASGSGNVSSTTGGGPARGHRFLTARISWNTGG